MPSYSSLISTKYFNPAFNSAIYDGPVRIYFAQLHESLALKIYFSIQQSLADEWLKSWEFSKKVGGNIHIMIYPNEEAFGLSFERTNGDKNFSMEVMNADVIVGMKKPIEENQLEPFIQEIKELMKEWAELIPSNFQNQDEIYI